MKFTVQRNRLTRKLRPDHKTIEGLLPPHLTIKLSKRVLLFDTSQPAVKKITRHSKRLKHGSKRQRKHQNQTWQGRWNYQTENLKQLQGTNVLLSWSCLSGILALSCLLRNWSSEWTFDPPLFPAQELQTENLVHRRASPSTWHHSWPRSIKPLRTSQGFQCQAWGPLSKDTSRDALALCLPARIFPILLFTKNSTASTAESAWS